MMMKQNRYHSIRTFLDQTIFGIGFPTALHSSLIDAPFDTSTLVDGAT